MKGLNVQHFFVQLCNEAAPHLSFRVDMSKSVEETTLEGLDSNGEIEIVLMYCKIGLVSETK